MGRIAALIALLVAAFSIGATPSQAATSSPWRVSTSPALGMGDNALNSVAAVSATDAWAVGFESSKALVEHWNGAKWAIVTAPGVVGDNLENVTAPSVSNVTILGINHGALVVLHYNGESWTRTMPPMPLNSNGQVDNPAAMTALSATDVWINVIGAVDHWNGKSWKGIRVDTSETDPSCGVSIGGIHAISDTDVWFTTNQQCNSDSTTVVGNLDQWNGTRVISRGAPTAPDQDAALTPLYGVASTGSDVWTVGVWDENSTLHGPLAGYWNGSKWASPTPNYYPTPHEFTAVAAASPTSVWAIGSRTDTNGTFNLLEYWNGSAWTEWGGPNPTDDNQLEAVAAVPHSTQFWAVGTTGTDPNQQPMILHCCG